MQDHYVHMVHDSHHLNSCHRRPAIQYKDGSGHPCKLEKVLSAKKNYLKFMPTSNLPKKQLLNVQTGEHQRRHGQFQINVKII